MADGDLRAQRRSGLGPVRAVLLSGLAGVALLAGVTGALAQDRTNVAPFTNSGAYAGNVLSNTSTITNTAPGYWTGAIQSNAGTITNNLSATWDGSVRNTGLVRNYGIWIGDVLSNSIGDIRNSGVGAVWTGDVTSNSQIVNENGATWRGKVLGNTNVIFNHANSSWIGDVVANGPIGQIDQFGLWTGDVRANAGSIYNLGGIWTGDVLTNTGGIYNNVANSTTNPNGVNAAQWSGDVVTNNGLIMNFALGTWTGEVLANAGDIANYGSWIGNLTTSGRIIHTGVWTGDVINSGTYFHAENQIVGAFDNRGWLQLTGNLSDITTFTNSGRLMLTQTSGAQTLSVGSAVLTPSSSYEIDVTAAGASDRLIVSGNATLGGTVRVLAATTGGPYTSPTAYTILTAGSISGTFAGVTTDLAFFAPHLTYDATSAYLTLKRNDVGFSTAGVTANQIGVGTTVEALRAGNPLYDAVLWLTQPEAEQAFDDLSGEAYASSESMALQNSNLVRDIALGRLRQIFEKPEQGDDSASGYAGRPILAANEGTGTGFWTQFYGAVGISGATGETSSLFASTGGVAIGLDGAAGPWNIGLTVHAGVSSNAVPALGSRIDSDDYGLGIYGGGEWGNTRLALGADYTRHAIHSTRSVSFPGFADALSADYAAGTVQAFAELSQRLDLGAVALTPYADLAHASHATDGFAETGGATALTSAGSVVDATFTTLGVRADQKFVVGDAMLLTANAALGWRHSFADVPVGTYALAGGSNFDIVGAPIASDVLVLGAGLNLDVSEASALDLTYDGQVGAGIQTHAFKATWATQF